MAGKRRKPTHHERVALIKALLAHAVAQHAMLQNPAHHSDMPPGAPPGPGGPMPMPGPPAGAGALPGAPPTGLPGGASPAFPFGQPPAGRMM